MLVDILDIYNLLKAYRNDDYRELILLLDGIIPKMLRFMNLMAHNDGGLSFFNDSADGIAPAKQRIEKYAKILGFDRHLLCSSSLQAVDCRNSGYMIASSAGNKLIFDAAVGPDYIPDFTLIHSFELSIGREEYS